MTHKEHKFKLLFIHTSNIDPVSLQLSDTTQYSYFARVVPADSYQARVIVDLLVHYNWTYISLVNSEGDYGENGAKAVYRLARERGLCVAMTHSIYRARGVAEFDDVARLLTANDKARAVVMFVQVNVYRKGECNIVLLNVMYCDIYIYVPLNDDITSCGIMI